MGIRIRNRKDVVAGLFYMLAGAGFALGSLEYRMGDAARMGPAYFPFWVGLLLVVVGVLTALGGVRASAEEEGIKRPDLRSLAWIIGAVVLFGATLEYLGLVLALALLVVVSMRASHEFSWKAAVVTTLALVAFSWVTFIWGIELQIDLWPEPLR
jgi:hypothetical protein